MNFKEELIKKVTENKGSGFFGVSITREKTQTMALGFLSTRQLCEVIVNLEMLTNHLKENFKLKGKDDIVFTEEK